MKNYRILVTGSRDWTDVSRIEHHLALLVEAAPASGRRITLVHGACPTGADAMADRWARVHGHKVEMHPADWNRFGKKAGFLRNKKMVDLGADVCLAFIKDNSKGATMTANLAIAAGIRTIIIRESL